jgi:poly(3-hydroxybutyrate) depolymerase
MIARSLAFLVAGLAFCSATPARATGEWHCPQGYDVHAGLNMDFPSDDGQRRAFIVVPPTEIAARPAPVWVPLTGTAESTHDNLHVLRSGANAMMAERGYMVIAPIRECASQDPTVRGGPCNGPGKNGWNWNPWHDGRAATPAGARWTNDAGPDVRLLEAMVRCVGTRWKLDASRLFLGGISAGATMTNRALLFDPSFWAGGLSLSGEWYATRDDGTPLSFFEARAAVSADPLHIFQGRVGPFPMPAALDPMIVITVWGGERDLWNCDGVLCADYRPSTQAGSNYFAAQSNVVHVACSANHGHAWPQRQTEAFNAWALATLSSHPKGSAPRGFKLIPPPEGYRCHVGAFTDHY